MGSKIYCKDCKHYVKSKSWCMDDSFHTFDCNDIHEQCNAPQNFRSNHRNQKSDSYVSCPSVINRFNNCKWFEMKEPDPFENGTAVDPDFINE